MPTEAEGRSHARTSVSGGASAEPTPANTDSGGSKSGSKSGDKSFHKGGSHGLLNQGPGHIVVSTEHKRISRALYRAYEHAQADIFFT